MRVKKIIRVCFSLVLAACLAMGGVLTNAVAAKAAKNNSEVVLRVCNWEEYIDKGDWDEEETIDLESGDIIGENSMVEDFEDWYYQTYGIRVRVEYSTFGTNEDLYNMLTLGDVYDVVCPSEYMIMKLMAENKLEPLSEQFFDTSDANNYYINGVSPYIRKIFDEHEIGGEAWSKYAAGYMWGVTGIVYNPNIVTSEEAGSWKILNDPKYKRQITVKDNVRDSYFAAVGALKSDLLTSKDFLSNKEYSSLLEQEMNDVSKETVKKVQDYLQDVKDNAYSFETDSGKADMVTGKVVANYQWSGDAVYTMDLAEEEDYYLNFAVPKESTNIYFDGWVMLKSGIEQDNAKRHAAEAFINFISRPDNAIRNMYYIGYTSVISGGEDNRIFEYADWCYGAQDDEEETKEYPLDYFFLGESQEETKENVKKDTKEKGKESKENARKKTEENSKGRSYVLTVPKDQINRQVGAQYPSQEVISRSCIMVYFDDEQNELINQMWIHVRCYNINDIPAWVWPLVAVCLAGLTIFFVRRKRDR